MEQQAFGFHHNEQLEDQEEKKVELKSILKQPQFSREVIDTFFKDEGLPEDEDQIFQGYHILLIEKGIGAVQAKILKTQVPIFIFPWESEDGLY